MLNFIGQKDVFGEEDEYHYKYHTQISPGIYPQVHNFYEIILVTSGILQMSVNETRMSLPKGNMVFIRPGDIHSKHGNKVTHINLAFPASVIDSLFEYLCDEETKTALADFPAVPPVFLTNQAIDRLEKKIQTLNTIGIERQAQGKTTMRRILFEVITQYFLSTTGTQVAVKRIPDWLEESLQAWQTEGHRQEGLDFFCERTGYTKEHLCRTFKRFMGISPNVYLNRQRLSYAVNLLLHSDHRILDIAYAAGFKSPSQFYRVFRESYGISPKQFCAQRTQWS